MCEDLARILATTQERPDDPLVQQLQALVAKMAR